jgi:hypothetical protein
MMTSKEIETYIDSRENFIKECKHVCNEMHRFDYDYIFLETFEVEGDNVEGEGEEHLWGGETDIVYRSFPVELLGLSNEELKQYVDGLIKEKEDQEKLNKQQTEDRQKARDLAEFNRLKEKLGL